MKIDVTTAPSSEPVSVADAATQVFGDATYDSTKLTRDIAAARLRAEQYCGIGFINQTWTVTLDGFPSVTTKNPRGIIYLPGKVQSLTSLRYEDSNGDTQTLIEDTDFTLDNSGLQGRLLPVSGNSWPNTTDYELGTVTIVYVTGFGADLSGVQYQSIIDAILLDVGTLYEVRQTVGPNNLYHNSVYQMLLHPFRDYFDYGVNDE